MKVQAKKTALVRFEVGLGTLRGSGRTFVGGDYHFLFEKDSREAIAEQHVAGRHSLRRRMEVDLMKHAFEISDVRGD